LGKEDYRSKKNLRARIIISGRVQGVLFRDSMKRQARKIGVFGWVRNIKSWKVEAIIEGDEIKVLKLIDWAHKGPLLAKVDNIDIFWEDYKKEFDDFIIKYN